jgi:outer membrane protein
VTQQYLTVLQAEATAALQDTLVTTAQAQVELARAKTAAGAGTLLEIRRAEVTLGQNQVAAIRAHNTAEVEMLRLFQEIGVPKPGPTQLTTKFPVAAPTFTLDSMLSLARRVNPDIASLRANERASELTVRVQRTRYLPSLGLSTGWGGNSVAYADPEFLVSQTRASLESQMIGCIRSDSIRVRVGLASQNCETRYVFTDADAAAIRSANNSKFPFKFNRQPVGISAGFSIPIFDGFQREQAVQQAQVARENVQYSLRARELQLTTEVTQSFLNVTAAVRAVALQEQNAVKAQEELQFAQERYRVGAGTFLDVTLARSQYEQAVIDRVNAIYDYHKAFAALESAVGRPLR